MTAVGTVGSFHHPVLPACEASERLFKAQFKQIFSVEGVPATKAMLTLCWEVSDTTGSRDSDTIEAVMRDVFGFETKKFKIPAKSSLNSTLSELHSFIASYDSPRSLLVLHYAGHGDRGNGLWVSGTRDFATNFSFNSVKDEMERHSHGDILFILDCCSSAAIVRGADSGRTVEILAACGETEKASDDTHRTFTHLFSKLARENSTDGPVSIQSLSNEFHRSDYDLVPFWTRTAGSHPIILNPVTSSISSNPMSTFGVVQFHVAERPESKECQQLVNDITLLRRHFQVSTDLATVLFTCPLQSSTMFTVRLPAPIYERLEHDMVFACLGYLRLSQSERLFSMDRRDRIGLYWDQLENEQAKLNLTSTVAGSFYRTSSILYAAGIGIPVIIDNYKNRRCKSFRARHQTWKELMLVLHMNLGQHVVLVEAWRKYYDVCLLGGERLAALEGIQNAWHLAIELLGPEHPQTKEIASHL
jgi:Caspase domain